MGKVVAGRGFVTDPTAGDQSDRLVNRINWNYSKPTQFDLDLVFSRGLSGADLARNPYLNPAIAIGLERERFLKGTQDDIFGGTTLLAEYEAELARLRQAYTDEEVTRQFGLQNVTSRTSTVNAQGVRTPIAGQGTTTKPTRKQLEKIGAKFQTPIELIRSGQSPSAAAAPKPRGPTIISGGGIRRHKLSGSPTILTSDSDESGRDTLGGSTILG